MRCIPLIFLLVLHFSVLSCQTNQKELQRLRNENDSLRLVLQKCQSGTLARPNEGPGSSDNPLLNRVRLHNQLLPQIRSKSEEKYQLAQATIELTDTFLTYCESTRSNLIQQTGGLNPENGQPLGYRDKKAPIQYFLTERRGAELKLKIDDLRRFYLKINQGDPDWETQIVLKTEQIPAGSRANTWEDYKFNGMPVAAVLPVIGKYQSDAAASEAAILNFLNQ